MEVLRIEWHRTSDEHGEGYMELILDKFFPCTIKRQTKYSNLLEDGVLMKQSQNLKIILLKKIEIVEKQIAEIKHIYPSTSVGSYEKKKCETDFKRLQTVMKKYNRMVKLLHTHTDERK